MQTLQSTTRGLGLILDLNWDRVLVVVAVVVGLMGGAMIGAEIAQLRHHAPPSYQPE